MNRLVKTIFENDALPGVRPYIIQYEMLDGDEYGDYFMEQEWDWGDDAYPDPLTEELVMKWMMKGHTFEDALFEHGFMDKEQEYV